MRRRKLIWRLVPSYIALTLLSLAAVGWITSTNFRKFYLANAQEELKKQAMIIRSQVEREYSVANTASLDSICKNLKILSETRITLIDADGIVLGDSDNDPHLMENHADRPEIKTALTGSVGVNTRYSTTLKLHMMYVSVPVLDENQQISGALRISVPLTEIDRAITDSMMRLTYSGIIIILLIIGVSYFISKFISRPIEEMRRSAVYFAEGNLNHRLKSSKIVELNSLSETLNQMATQLDQRIQTISKQRGELEAVLSSMTEGVIAVDMDEYLLRANKAAEDLFQIDMKQDQGRLLSEVVRIPDIQKFTSKVLESGSVQESEISMDSGDRFLTVHGSLLNDANNHRMGALVVVNDITQLKKLETIRKDFAANVSHELRTPITAIKGFIETLRDGAFEDKDNSLKFLDIVINHINRLNAIIEDLLKLARLEQEKKGEDIELTQVNIRETISNAVKNCGGKAEKRGIKLNVKLEVDLRVMINSALLEQAIVNLVDNAINYSSDNNVVEIGARLSTDGKSLEVFVKDDGCGIEAKHLQRIFERFYRVDKNRSRIMGGTGLGLAIVKHIAMVHKGKVAVVSNPGKGSTFSIYLPY